MKHLQKFTKGALFEFVKSIQAFLKTFKCKNIYMLCVCLSQIRKCLLIYETTVTEKNTIKNFDKVCISFFNFNLILVFNYYHIVRYYVYT